MKNFINFINEVNIIKESITYDVNDLILDENEVEEYYIRNHSVSEEEYINYGSMLLNYISDNNKDVFMSGVIEDEKNNFEFSDYDDEDKMEKYIQHLIKNGETTEKEIDIFIKENEYEIDLDIDISEKLGLLSVDELKELIEDVSDKYDFAEYVVTNDNSKMTLYEYMIQQYSVTEYYDILKNFLDYKTLDKEINEDASLEDMVNFFTTNLPNTESDQYDILNYNSKNIIYLFDIIDDGQEFGKDPENQLLYLTELKKDVINTTSYDTLEEIQDEWDSELDDHLIFIENKFGLSEKIINLYPKKTKRILLNNKKNKYKI